MKQKKKNYAEKHGLTEQAIVFRSHWCISNTASEQGVSI